MGRALPAAASLLLALAACRGEPAREPQRFPQSAPPRPAPLVPPAPDPAAPPPFSPAARATASERTFEALVLDAFGAPAAGARVLLWADGWLVARGTTGPDGRATLGATLRAEAQLLLLADGSAGAARLLPQTPQRFTGRLEPEGRVALAELQPCTLAPQARALLGELGVSPCLGGSILDAYLTEAGPLGLRSDGARVVVRYGDEVRTATPTIVLGPRGRLLTLEGGALPADRAAELHGRLAARIGLPPPAACRAAPDAREAPPPLRFAAYGVAIELTLARDCSIASVSAWTE